MSRHDYGGKPRPTIDLRPPMVIRGFGNSPVPSEMFIPPGTVPPITDVTYAGSYPLRHYITNPPITTPEYPANPPRATNKAPVRPFAPYDRLTNTRATTAQIPTAQLGSLRGMTSMGALPAGAYSGAVGRVVRVLDPSTGAGLRGQVVGARLHGYDAPPAYLHGAHGSYLHGLGAAPEALELKQAIPQDVADVARFTIADPRTVKGQLVGTRLVLVGVKEGSTKVEVEDTSGTRSEIRLTVKGLLPAEQMAVAQETFNAIKSLTGSRPDLRIDWQDADVIRANYDLIYPILRKLFATARTLGEAPNTYRPERYQALQLLRILVNAKSRPDLKTLREVVFSTPPYTESGTSISVPTPATATTWSTSSRECTVEGGVRYRKLYAFARDYTTFVDITNAALKITEIVGKVWSMFDPVTGKMISDGAKAAAAIAAPAMAEFARSPKSLVADFGGAVCLAVAGGTAAMPVTVRAASELRKRAWLANQRYKLLKAAGRLSGLGAPPMPNTAEEAREQAQAALAQLETLDTPGAFTPAENAQLAEVRAEVNAGTSLGPSRGGTTESTGVPGWVWGVGAVALIGGGFLLLRKRGK